MVKRIPARSRLIKSKTGTERRGILQTPARITISSNDTPEAIKTFLKSIKTSEKAVINYIAELEEFAQRKLTEAGINHEHGNLLGHVQGKKLEPVWFAAKILTEARLLRIFINEGSFFEALQSALLMEGARGDYNFSITEHETLIGMSLVEGGAASKKYTNKEKDEWIASAKALFKRNDRYYLKANGKNNYTEAALQIQVDNGYKFQAQQTIYRHLLKNTEKM